MEYAELLEIIKRRYFEVSGHHLIDSSESGIRLKVMAYVLAKFGAKLKTKLDDASLLTAKGAALDGFGKMLGIKREAGKARGSLKVFGALEQSEPIVIMQGAEFRLQGARPLQFRATKESRIEPKNELAELEVEAESAGIEYNLPAGAELQAIDTEEVAVAISAEDFKGGYEVEDDESYRSRMLGMFEEWMKLRR